MENIYIKAMEIGFENPKGITYLLLKEKIEESIGESLNQNSEHGLIEWFLDSFVSTSLSSHPSKQSVLAAIRTNNVSDNTFERFQRSEWTIAGQTTKQYIDYLELKESRENAQRAFNLSTKSNDLSKESLRISNRSFWVAILAFAIPTFLTLMFHFTQERPAAPPFDVKIIEDKTSTPQLEKENKELKEKLYEAEMLIDAYEEKKA